MKGLIFIKRNPVFVYLFLVFVLSWGFILLIAGAGNVPLDAEKSEEILPLLYILMLLGPATAGILMVRMLNGKKGLRTLRSRLTKWKVGFRWYAAAVFTAPVLATVLLLFLSRLNADFIPAVFGTTDTAASIGSGIIIGLLVGTFEEAGWSGFLVPVLRKRFKIFITGLIVGLIWGGWHFILFWESNSFSGNLPLLILLGRLFFWLPPFRVFMVWIYDRTKSLLLVILSHASLVFSTTVLVPMSLTGVDLFTWLILWGAVLWILVLALYIGRMFSMPRKTGYQISGTGKHMS